MAVRDELTLKRRLRLRELARFYSATAPSPLAAGNDSIAPSSVVTRLASETNLTALAQLAALRCNCQRSFISLIDADTQHIVAEASRSISLYDPNIHDPDDHLLFGVQSWPLRYGVCPSTLEAFMGEADLHLASPGSVATDAYVLIPDLLSEPLTMRTPALENLPPVLRYYLEVPLKSAAGHVLGSICVIDPVVRTAGPAELPALQEIATLIVQNFEQIALKEDHGRAERLLEGLGHFVQGKSSLSLWSQSAPNQKSIPNAFAELGGVSSANLSRHTGSQDDEDGTKLDLKDTSSASRPLTEASTESIDRRATESTTDTSLTIGSEGAEMVSPSALPEDVTAGPSMNKPPATPGIMNIRQAFSRASNLIRESLDLDATSFLEVPHNERHKSLNSRASRKRQKKAFEDLSPDEADLSPSSLSESPFEGDGRPTTGDATPRSAPKNEMACHRLGFSTTAKSSLANSTTAAKFLTIPTHLLSRLAARYPNGTIFHFDSAGSISSGDDSSQNTTPGTHRVNGRPRKESEHLFKLFPAARSLAFVPLYDNDRQHIYAGFLGWTTNPARVLQKHELIYISAFANSVMCEVMRLDALATDKAKSNFISSMSHELRSPLHGILAAGHLLSESGVSRQQAEFISMVNTCAQTLLDTMNHLLDHAKINNFTKTQKLLPNLSTNGDTAGAQKDSFSLVSEVNMLSLVEDTLVSMGISSQWPQNKQDTDSRVKLTPDREVGVVPVILTMRSAHNWVCQTEPGSWRRIIMNLVGNAIKYTQRGHIAVELVIEQQPKSKRFPDAGHVAELRISDTGQGISEAYLKHRLFTPFAQENNLSVGAGLGLSLVSQIVSSLHGTIDVKSEIDTGSEFIVRVPLTASDHDTLGHRVEKAIPDDCRKVALIGFDEPPSISEAPDGVLDLRASALLVLKGSLISILTERFDIQIDSVNPEVYIIELSSFESQRARYDQPGNRLLLVSLDGKCSVATRAHQAQCVFLLPPFGPKQIANALTCLYCDPNEDTIASPSVEMKIWDGDHGTTSKHVAVAVDEPLPSPAKQERGNAADVALEAKSKLESTTLQVSVRPNDSVPSPQNATTGRSSSSPTPQVNKRAFLLVDDNDINLRLLVTCAKKFKDMALLTATNGKEALDRYRAAAESGTEIVTIFMDISMPVMNGFESTRRIRTHEQKLLAQRKDKNLNNKRCKIVALTGLGSANAESEIFESGFDLYFRKPVSPKTLRDMMAEDATESGAVET